MLKEKAGRLFRRIKRNWRPLVLMWLPAGIVALFLGVLFFSVGLSRDASFYSCSRALPVCMGKDPDFPRVVGCSYRTLWCDAKIVWEKANGRPIPFDLPDLPPVDEKAEKELFEKLTSDDFLETKFREFSQEEQDRQLRKETLPEKENLKKTMEKAREERVRFEAEMADKMKALAAERSENVSPENILSGQTEK